MIIKKISKSDVKELLKRSVEKWETYVPQETDEGDTLFTFLPKKEKELEKALERVNLRDEWAVVSAKDIFFPQIETMFSFDEGNIREEVETSRKLIFGVKPCDVKGISFADEFFKRDFEDKYYLSRAKDRVIVTIGCLTPPRPEACFCTSTKTGPFLEEGFDVQLVDAGDEYIVEIASDKGREFVDLYPAFFKDTEGDTTGTVLKIKSEAALAVKLKVDFEKALEIMKGEADLDEIYERIGERCLYCGACLYACPTCTCFNVFDEKEGNSGVRKRNWDGCIFEGYTREASQHNPRKEKSARTARRYEHKLKYDNMVAGMSGCVGCGRCLASCPVNLGMSNFIKEITELARRM